MNCLLGRRFTLNVKTSFLWKLKKKKKNIWCRLVQILHMSYGSNLAWHFKGLVHSKVRKLTKLYLIDNCLKKTLILCGCFVQLNQIKSSMQETYLEGNNCWVPISAKRKFTITKTRLFKYTENFTSKNRKFSDKKNLKFFIFPLKT